MPQPDPFEVPVSLPDRTLSVGPPSWRCRLGSEAGPIAGADSIDGLPPDTEPRTGSAGPASPFLLLLHADFLLADRAVENLAADLQRIQHQFPGALPVLQYRELEVGRMVALFRAGLFDAIASPADRAAWTGLIDRIRQRQRRAEQVHLVQRESAQASHQLKSRRRQLQEQVLWLGDELIATQERLERTNRELNDHMAQLSLLYKFGRELSTARNWDATLRSLLENLAGFVGAGGAALVLRSAPDGPYRPRHTYRWEAGRWDEVLLHLEEKTARKVAEGVLAPGIFQFAAAERQSSEDRKRIVALPLDHQSVRLGYLLLLDVSAASGQGSTGNHLAFLQSVKVILAEEVAGAQVLDRLREMGAFNAKVLDTVKSGIWVLDELGRTIFCNRVGHQLLTGGEPAAGFSAGTSFFLGRGRAGRQAARPVSPFADNRLRDVQQPEIFLDGLLRLDGFEGMVFRQLYQRGANPFRGEGRIVRPGGEVIPVLVQTSSMAGRDEGESWLVLVLEDLTETKKLEAERSRADSLESLVEMSATLAHEIRNPLTGLSAQAELLADQLPPQDRRIRYLDVIRGEVDRINDTINRLLNFVRPYEPRLSRVDINQLAADCLELVRPKAEAKEVRLVLTSAADPRGQPFLLDSGQIKQVLLNLLLNGVDAAPSRSEVTLVCRADSRLELTDREQGITRLEPGLVLEVTDSGEGVPPADRERIFRPFYTTKNSGTGLGLSICRKIVLAHGGEIRTVRSNNRTVFRVLLPEADARVDAIAKRQEHA